VVTGACHQLRKAAAGGLEPLEVSALVKTTREILGRNDPGLVDRTLPGIMRALRPAKGDCLAAFVAELCRLSTTTELLWPHLVNELLMGLEGRDRRERRLFHTMAAGLPEKTMERNLSRLEGLPALAQGQLAKSIFDPPESTLFPLYAILLGTAQGEVIGGLLCKGLSSRKPSWPGMEALKFISHFQPHHAELLAGLLREDQVEEKSYALRESACALINEGLLSLAPGERDQGWIIGPIQALGSLQIEEGRRSLGRIVSQRKWVVFPAWPAPCREEAKRALHRLAVGSDREGRA
jgi:hypothetical protein